MRLLLARHGQSVWNEVRRFQGSTDIALTDLGRRQAAALGESLRGTPLSAVYVSPLARARETAEIALESAAAVPVGAGAGARMIPVEELRELSLGDWEGCSVEEIRKQTGDPYAAWVRAPLDCPPPGAEPLDEVRRRVQRAIDDIAASHEEGDDVLLVTHGGVISVYACHVLGCSLNDLWRLRIDNCSLTVVRPPRLQSLNDTRHLTGPLAPGHLVRLEAVNGRRSPSP